MTERALPRSLPPRCLNRAQSAEYVGIGVSTFDELIREGKMPRPFRIRSRVLWDRFKLDASIDALSDQADDRWLEPAA